MNAAINYQKVLEKTIDQLRKEEKRPSLLLHSCCAPCSSYVLEYLSSYFEITVLYFNPNISPAQEYEKRAEEQKRLIQDVFEQKGVTFLAGRYEPESFYKAVKGMEQEPEGGKRCFVCYEQRLREAAVTAKEGGFDYFTTTLSISPLKNAAKLNEIGGRLAEEYQIPYLFSDFKKKNGYRRSIELSREYGLYRQNFCGCVFSRRDGDDDISQKRKN